MSSPEFVMHARIVECEEALVDKLRQRIDLIMSAIGPVMDSSNADSELIFAEVVVDTCARRGRGLAEKNRDNFRTWISQKPSGARVLFARARGPGSGSAH